MATSRRIRWVKHIQLIVEIRHAQTILNKISERKISLSRPRCEICG